MSSAQNSIKSLGSTPYILVASKKKEKKREEEGEEEKEIIILFMTFMGQLKM